MADYKSLQVAEALQRVSQQLKPQVTYRGLSDTAYSHNTNNPAANLADLEAIQRNNEAFANTKYKTGGDYIQDAAVALGKGIIGVPQAAAGLVDLADAGLQGTQKLSQSALAALGLTDAPEWDVQGGRFTKALEDVGVGFKESQDFMSGLYSDAAQQQLQGLSQIPGMSTEKSLGENLSSLGQTASYVLDNPSLALNTIVESVPSILAGGVVGRGAAAIGAPRAAAGAIGEGTIMAGQAQANMDRNPEGYTTGSQALGALGIGVLGGAVGQLGNRIAARHGASDVDQLAVGNTSRAASQAADEVNPSKKGLSTLAVGTATEAAEEAAQSSLENVISNITSGKDAIEGLNQDLVLGTLAGAGMGAGVNAHSSIASAALEAVNKAATRQAERIQEKREQAAPEQSDTPTEAFADTNSPEYNPEAVIIRQMKDIKSTSTPEEVEQVKQQVNETLDTAEAKLAEYTEMKAAIESENTWLNNLQGALAAVEQFAETEPARAANAQKAIDTIIMPKLEQIEQIKAATNIETIDNAIEHTTELVTKARDRIDTYAPLLNQASQPSNTESKFEVTNVPEIVANGGGKLNVVNTTTGSEVPFNTFAVTVEDGFAEVVHVEKDNKKPVSADKGAGIEAYRQLGTQLAEQGITLTSSSALKADGKKLWDTLVQEGSAVKTSAGYSFKPIETQTPDQKIFGAPTSFSVEEIQAAINDERVPEESKVVLRALSEAVVAQNAVKSIDAVNQQVVGKKYDPNYRSTPKYLEQFTSAIKRNSLPAQQNLMREITAFETSHIDKSNKLNEAISIAASQGIKAQIVRTKNNGWEVRTDNILKSDGSRETNGAYTVNPTPRGLAAASKMMDYLTTESTSITATRMAMEAMQEYQAKPVDTAMPTNTEPTFEQEQPLDNPSTFTDFDAAMEDYNQSMRDDYDFQPERKVVDPRSSTTRSSSAAVEPTTPSTQTEVQPATSQTTETPEPIKQEYDLVFDENGVGSNVPKANNKVTLTTKNKYGEKDQAKADLATKFIGQGSETSSTNQYAQDFGDKANTGTYTADDTVFVSAEGARNNRIEPNYTELDKAIQAGATFITDDQANRERPYNVGEREVAKYLTDNGYVETKSGTWTPQPLAQTERVASRSDSEDVATEAQTSTDAANQVTQEESTNQIVSDEVHKEAEPQDVNTAEKAEKNPERTAERAKEPNKRNLVIDGFNKRDTVLNKYPNFTTRFMQRDNLAPVYEAITKELPSEKQHQALKDFAKFANYFSTKLDGLIGDKQFDFRHQDFNQYLLEDGKLPENVKTAVSAAMYTWLAENGSKTLNTDKDVLGLLLVNNVDESSVPNRVFEALTAVGDHQAVVTGSLGQKALEALGLKVVSDVDPARKQKLEQGLGTLAAVALSQNGYLTRTSISAKDFAAMQNEAIGDNDKATTTDMGLPSDSLVSFLVPTDSKKVKQVVESAADTKGIVHSMFGIQRDNKMPSLEPVKTTPHSFNRMGSPLPDYTKKMIEAAQQNAYKMSAPAMAFIDNVDKKDLLELFGFVEPNEDGESFEGMHKKFWKGQLATNQSIERAIALISEQRTNLGDDSKPFYFEHTSWTNTRSGYDSAFNLQANKMHRAVAGMADHVVQIGVEAPIKNGETTKFGEFLMAVAMTAEEIKIGLKTVDKVSAETYLARFQEYLAQDYVQDAIESMAAIIEGIGTKEDMVNVKALTKEFGMGAMSVRGIQALAQMHIAERDGQRTFTSDIGFESDGVTNGPIITNVALATAYADMLEAGGIFTDKNKTNVPTNKEQGAQDIYEQLGEVMQQAWADKYKEAKKPVQNAMDALSKIYPVFGKRNGAKPIVTTSNYGAGNASIIRANGREVLNSFYKSLEKSANDAKAANDLIAAANVAISYGAFISKKQVPLAVAKGNPLEFMLTPAQEAALLEASANLHGKAIKESLDKSMAEFQGVRDTLTELAVTGFSVYEIIRNAAIQEALKDTSGIILDGKGNRQEGLSSDQMKKVLKSIERYTPSVVSGMGNMSDNRKKSSIPLMKQDTVWDASRMSEQQFNFMGSWEAKGNKKFTSRSSIKRDSVSDPGVSGLALIIQSIDAMIAHTTIGKIPSQNYHDANASAVGKGKEMARIQNEAFVDGLMNTHVNREFVRALLNPLSIILEDTPFAKEHRTAFSEQAKELGLVQQVKDAYQRDWNKLNGMLTWSNVNQYGTQGGHYVMTDAKRKAIINAQEKLKKDMAKDLALAERIQSVAENKSVKPSVAESRFIGTFDAAKAVPELQAALKTKQDKHSQFYESMLDLVTERMPAGTEINIFDAIDPPANVTGLEEALKNNNPAWYTKGVDGKPQINILNTGKPLEAKVLVHELVHAITVDSIDQVRNDSVTHAKAKESLDKLDALYEHIKAQVKADPNATDLMKYATQNVEEFIATGFSYPEFVDYLDNTLAPKAARGKNRIVTALRSFVDNILGVLENFTGRKYSAKDATALEALILDTTEFLGRTPSSVVGTQNKLFGAPQNARDKVAGFSSKEVFESLDTRVSPTFKAHLSSLMTQVSDTIYSGLNQTLVDNPDGTWSVEKAWENFITGEKAMTTQTATTAGFRMSDQENFAVESLYAAMVHGLKDKTMSQAYSEMNKAFNTARNKLKPENFYTGDWNTASVQDKRDAQDMYDFIFKYGRTNPEPLARFTAMALGSEQFNSMLGFKTDNTTTAPKGAFEKLVNSTNSLLDYVGGLLTNSSSAQLINNKLGLLAKELARIDAKNRDFSVNKIEDQLERITDHTDNVSKKLREKVVQLAEHDSLANSRFTSVRLASNTTRLAAKGDLWTTLDVIKDGVTLNNPNSKLGFIGELINEAANNDSVKNNVEKLLRMTKLNNQMKENIRDATRKNVMSTFEENGAYLTIEDKSSISTMLRSDVQSLLGTFSVKEIADMYSDKNFLASEMNAIESQLNNQVMVNRAKQLAKYMITGKSSNGLAKNARLIVSGFNAGGVVAVNDPRVDAVDRLATMYAILYTPTADKARINNLMKLELKNKVNGMDTAIRFHKELSNNAKKVLFRTNNISAIKGYIPDITNPNREVRIATNAMEEEVLKNMYFSKVSSLAKDKNDPTSTVHSLYVTEEANIQRLVSGAIEVVSTNRMGTGLILDAKERDAITNSISKSLPTSPTYNPMNDKDVYLVPNYNTMNEVIGYSYEMSGKNRDTLLERNNDFADLLGAYAATNYNKTTVPFQNERVVDAALEDYKDNYADNPRAYVNVSPNSDDVGLRELWAMLPESTRQHIDATWGKDGMYVRNDVLLTMFGYRKYSLNQSFDKMDEAKSMFEKLYTGIMTELFGNKAKIRGVQAERAWQESIGLMKDIIVIRNVKTMLANTMSNAMLLSAHGVSPSDIVKDSVLAIRAGMQYRKDVATLLSLQQRQRAGIGDFNKQEQDILRAQESLARNPLASFIEEGMMPTIVEDVDPDTNHYSYKNKLQQRIDEYTESVPKSVKTAAKWAFVSPDTPLYKFLNNATQFSDFSSKYVMYKYYTSKAKDKLSHDEALQVASDNFVNYDVPTSRGLQYLNDMGIVMFTKYNIRIQKALFQLLKKRPATAMAQAVMINSFTNLEAGIEPLLWFNIGNPLRGGALGVPSALDEPMPIKMLSSVF